jgi:hypothetical protein
VGDHNRRPRGERLRPLSGDCVPPVTTATKRSVARALLVRARTTQSSWTASYRAHTYAKMPASGSDPMDPLRAPPSPRSTLVRSSLVGCPFVEDIGPLK